MTKKDFITRLERDYKRLELAQRKQIKLLEMRLTKLFISFAIVMLIVMLILVLWLG